MNLQELQELVDKRTKIDQSDLDLESLKTPEIHNEFLKIFNNESLLLKKRESELSTLRKRLWLYYSGKAPEEVYRQKPLDLKILRNDLKEFIDSDEEYIEATNKVAYQKQKVIYLEEVIKMISNRTWMIKNAVQFRQFLNGG